MVCHSDEPVDPDGRRLVVSGEFAAEQSFEESNGRQGTAARRFLMATSTFFFNQMAMGPFSSQIKIFGCHVNGLTKCREVFSDTN